MAYMILVEEQKDMDDKFTLMLLKLNKFLSNKANLHILHVWFLHLKYAPLLKGILTPLIIYEFRLGVVLKIIFKL